MNKKSLTERLKDKEIEEREEASEKEALKLLRIARFILANTPMVAGYAETNELISHLGRLVDETFSPTFQASNPLPIDEWDEIKKVLLIGTV